MAGRHKSCNIVNNMLVVLRDMSLALTAAPRIRLEGASGVIPGADAYLLYGINNEPGNNAACLSARVWGIKNVAYGGNFAEA